MTTPAPSTYELHAMLGGIDAALDVLVPVGKFAQSRRLELVLACVSTATFELIRARSAIARRLAERGEADG